MDLLQHRLVAEFVASERQERFLSEVAKRGLVRLAQPDIPWREWLAQRLVVAALLVAPSDSALRHQPGHTRMLVRG